MTLITSHELLTKDTVNLKRSNQLSIETASKCSQISKLKREAPKGTIEASVVALLSQLKMYVKIEVDDEWLFDWAETLIADFWYFRIEDMILAFKQGATKKQYGSVLLSDIMQWCRDYDAKRMDYHENRNKDFKEGYDSNRGSEMTIKKYFDK